MSLRILFVSPYLPSRQRVRTLGFVSGLAQRGHRLTLLAANPDRQPHTEMERLCERVETVHLTLPRRCRNAAQGLLAGLPLQAALFDDADWSQRVQALWQNGDYDILHIEHMRAAPVGLAVPQAARVFDAVDCLTDLLDAASEHAHPRLARAWAAFDHPRTQRYEARLIRSFDSVIVTSAAEAQALQRVAGDPPSTNLRVVPNGIDLEHFTLGTEPRDTSTVLFVGRMGYHANVTAAAWLLRQVMPLVWQRVPQARVILCGADPSRELRRLARRYGERVSVTGTVADVRPYLWCSTVAVSPIRYGAGVQNKVLEALAAGIPVVATPVSCAALSVRDGNELMIAAGADDFANRVVALLHDDELRRQIAQRGRAHVAARHAWATSLSELEDVYDAAIRRHRETARAA